MAPTPLTVGYRLTFRYTVDGFQHKQQNYCECVPSADVSGYDLVGRAGVGNAPVSTQANQFFAVVAPFWDITDTTFDGYTLEKRAGTIWTFLFSGSTTVVPSGATPRQKANGYCVSGKDTDNKRFPAYIYEGAFGTSTKIASYASLAAADKGLANWFYNVNLVPLASSAWNWRRSRNGKLADRWLAAVIDSNEKLRRLRRIK